MGSHQPGRACPTSYRYRPSELSEPTLAAETLYVVGGLYGNGIALDEIRAIADQDPSGPAAVVFNGDFNWLNVEPAGFESVNERILARHATQGNIEAELAADSEDGGCGCGYPDYVDDTVVERSNAMMSRLQATSREFPAVVGALGELTRHVTVQMGAERVAVIHGDPESLAGWGLALESVEPPDEVLRTALGCLDQPTTTMQMVEAWFAEAGVHVFASTHTGLPYAQDFSVAGRRCAVINNGSAGLPCFEGGGASVITRISLDPRPHPLALYGVATDRLRCDALGVHFDAERWQAEFLAQWPPGTAGHDGYWTRITSGTSLLVDQAARSSAGRSA
jgi:hypothetical protein